MVFQLPKVENVASPSGEGRSPGYYNNNPCITYTCSPTASVVVGFVQFSERTGGEEWRHSPAPVSTNYNALLLVIECIH